MLAFDEARARKRLFYKGMVQERCLCMQAARGVDTTQDRCVFPCPALTLVRGPLPVRLQGDRNHLLTILSLYLPSHTQI